jgi:hypothetical protein
LEHLPLLDTQYLHPVLLSAQVSSIDSMLEQAA